MDKDHKNNLEKSQQELELEMSDKSAKKPESGHEKK
jgi:hypothetical protein